MLKALRILYAPAMLLGFVGAAVLIVAQGISLLWLPALLLVAVAASFAVEQLVPYDTDWNRDHGDRRRDVAHAIVNEVSTIFTVALIPLLTTLAPDLGMWPSHWPLALQLLAAILVADAGITLTHRLSHRIDWLWRLHAPHHSVRRLYGLNGLMKHPLHQTIEVTAGTLPLVLAGMPIEVGALLGLAVAIQLLLQHGNVDMRIGALAYVLALGPVHRFHHVGRAGEGDVNFGLFTTIWDRLMRTARFDAGKRFTSFELGIEDRPDYPTGYVAQLIEPFRPSRAVLAVTPNIKASVRAKCDESAKPAA